MINQKD